MSMNKVLALREKAKKDRKKIVLPEGGDARVVRAAALLANEGIVDVCLLGKEDMVRKVAAKNDIKIDKVNIQDPATHDKREEIMDTYFELRKSKGLTREEAEKAVMDNLVFYAALMTRMGAADGFVAGASHTTSDVARAAIHCLKIVREIGTVSSAFIMEMPDSNFGENGLLIYGDCGIVPYPSARQLSGIAIASSDLMRKLFGVEPRVALLSYSTKGSAKGESIETIRAALEKIKTKRPDLIIDGELQVDAAMVPEVAKRKCPNSPVAGKANVLIFPNLDAGNISYKLSQRLANARAVGPIIQGLDKPCSDLSRGCSWEDVVDTAVVTAIIAQGI
ncbi:MAG: phosphate acetyltransferase [Candidatus Omnitrophota bacterium]